jgi:NMD protein affecting ribosome stability and mRNA decay
MTLKRPHKHKPFTVHAIRQRAGVPYHVERQVCSNCSKMLDEKTIKRAAA